MTRKLPFSATHLGVLAVLAFAIISPAKDVVVAHMLQGQNPLVLLVSFFATVALFFSLVALPRWRDLGALLRRTPSLVLLINATTVGSWFGFFYALRTFEPAVAIAFVNSLGPIVTLLLEPWITSRSSSLKDYAAACGVVSGMALLGFATASGSSGVGSVSTSQLALGGTMAVVCGVSMALNTLVSKKMNMVGWKPQDIMSVRFFLLLALGFTLADRSALADLATSPLIGSVVALALVGVVLPLYLLQIGIQKVEPFIVAMTLIIAPVVAFAVQLGDRRLSISWLSIAGILICIGFSILGTIFRMKESAPCRS